METVTRVTQRMMRKYMKKKKKEALNQHTDKRDEHKGEKKEEEKKSPEPTKSRKEWSKKFEDHCTEVFEKCENPTVTAQINSLYVGLIIYWTKYHTLEGKDVDDSLRDILNQVNTTVKSRYSTIDDKRRNMLERDGLRKGLRRAYRTRLAEFKKREDWMPNKSSEFAYIWREEVTEFEDVGVGASWMLQTNTLPYDLDRLPSRHAASSVDKGGTIFMMIYDARDHRLIRVGLGLAEYIDGLKKEYRKLQGEIAKNPHADKDNRRRRIRMKEINATCRREVDKAHDIVIKLLTSTVKLANGTKERRFSMIANPKMNVKGMTSKKGNLSKRCRRQLRSLRFGEFDYKLEQAVLYGNRMDGKISMTIDTSGEPYTTSTCNCCGEYTPGIGRGKLFRCSDQTCMGRHGVLRDAQGAINICIQMLFKQSIRKRKSAPESGSKVGRGKGGRDSEQKVGEQEGKQGGAGGTESREEGEGQQHEAKSGSNDQNTDKKLTPGKSTEGIQSEVKTS